MSGSPPVTPQRLSASGGFITPSSHSHPHPSTGSPIRTPQQNLSSSFASPSTVPLPATPASALSPSAPSGSPQIALFDQLAEQLYTSTSSEARFHAYSQLSPIVSQPEGIPQCRLILEHSSNQYSLLLAANSLNKLSTNYFQSFSTYQTIEMKNFLLNYIAAHSQKQLFLLNPLIECLLRVVKLGWRLDSSHSDILSDITRFLTHSPQSMVLAFLMMKELLALMNSNTLNESQHEHRKTARLFRDNCLQTLFGNMLGLIQRLSSGALPIPNPQLLDTLYQHAFSVVSQCLSFDFIGALIDESFDDIGSSSPIAVPSQWRPIFEDQATIALFVDLIPRVTPHRHSQLIEILGLISAVRRSLFTSDQSRNSFVTRVISSFTHILSSHSTILNDSDSSHAFVTALARFYSSQSLVDFIKLQGTPEFLQLTANFSLSLLNRASQSGYDLSIHTFHYLLLIWYRIASEASTIRDFPLPLKEQFVLFFHRTVEFRLEQIGHAFDQDDIAFDYDDFSLSSASELSEQFELSTLEDQLKYYPSLIKFAYEDSKNFLKSRFQTLLEAYSNYLSHRAQWSQGQRMQFHRMEAQLALLVYTAGATIGLDRSSHISLSRDAQEQYDAELVALMLKFLQLFESSRLVPGIPLHPATLFLSRAFLSFLQQLRVRFISMVNARHQVYSFHYSTHDAKDENSFFIKLSSCFNGNAAPDAQASLSLTPAPNQTVVTPQWLLTMILQVIFHFLSAFSRHEELMTDCVELLDQLFSGYNTGYLMSQIEPIQKILQAHSFDAFPFLNQTKKLKLHTQFYVCLGRVLFKSGNTDHFLSFMNPFENLMISLHQAQTQGKGLRVESIRDASLATIRKLTGLLEATTGIVSYNLMFDWMFPAHLPVLVRLFETWLDDEKSSTAILYLFTELATNRNQRVKFDANSPNGIILFKEIAKILQMFAHRLMQTSKADREEEFQAFQAANRRDSESGSSGISNELVWKKKLKGIHLCLKLFTQLLNGNYTPFALMTYYRDQTLSATLKVLVQLVNGLRHDEIFGFAEFSQSYFAFLSSVLRVQPDLLMELDTKSFLHLLHHLLDALTADSLKYSVISTEAFEHLFSSYNHAKRKLALENQWNSVKAGIRQPPAALTAVVKHFEKHFETAAAKHLLFDVFACLLNVYLFHPQANGLYSLSKPIYHLALIEPEFLNSYLQRLASIQLPEFQSRLSRAFDPLIKQIAESAVRFAAAAQGKKASANSAQTFSAMEPNETAVQTLGNSPIDASSMDLQMLHQTFLTDLSNVKTEINSFVIKPEF